jgi:hypothetical protein
MSFKEPSNSSSTSFGSYLKKEMIDNFSCSADAVNFNHHFVHHKPKTENLKYKPIFMRKYSDPNVHPQPNRPYGDTYFGHI